jgi:Flp pilus assembly protein TadD
MSTVPQDLQAALAHHQAGRLDEAEQLYRRVLAREPRHAAAFHLLGVTALQRGRLETAVEQISAAIRLNATRAPFHCHLGEA